MGKIVLDKVLGKNLQDFADNIDKNFSRIEGNGVWRGEKGESYAEQTIGLWKEDTDGSIVILNEPILETLFTESDGGSTAWPVVKAWAADKRDQFLALQIPKAWSLYPGFPLYYSQPAECFKLFKSDAYDTGADWSGMVAAVGSDDGSYTYKRYDILPRIYLDRVTGNYCWMINGVKTGITASINPDQETRNIRLYLIRTDAAGDTKYLVSKESGTAWTDKPDTLPRIGDFAWRLETKSITTGGVEKPAQVLEVCIYSGEGWVAATADDNNENFFLTYDDMVMHYVWDSIYGGLGDVYDADMRAIGTKSFQFPTHRDNGTATADTHKITSKSYADGTRSDLFVENPYKGQATGGLPDVKSNIVLSGYDDVYLGTPTMNPEGGVNYADERLVKKSEFDAARADINKRLADLESHVIKTITIEELWSLASDDVNDGDIYKIDRCYWKDAVTPDNKYFNYNAVYIKSKENSEYVIRPYVRYVYVKAHNDNHTTTWSNTGVGLIYICNTNSDGDIHEMCYPVEVNLNFKHNDLDGDVSWYNNYGGAYINTTNVYIGRQKDSPADGRTQNTYIYDSNTTSVSVADMIIESSIDINKFGFISWMKDPIYKNECDWDFVMYDTFLIKYTYHKINGANVRRYTYTLPYFSIYTGSILNDAGYAYGCAKWFYNNKLSSYISNNIITIPDIAGDGDISTIYSMIIINISSLNHLNRRSICRNNIFISCPGITINIRANDFIAGFTYEMSGNYIYDSRIIGYTSTFTNNNIRNSELNIGNNENNEHHCSMESCNITDSTIRYCIGIERGFQYNDNNRLLSIKNPAFFDVLFQYCDFNHIRNLGNIFIICPTDHLYSDNGYGYIDHVIFEGDMVNGNNVPGIPCQGDGINPFTAYFIGVDVPESNFISFKDSDGLSISPSRVVHSTGRYDESSAKTGTNNRYKKISYLSRSTAKYYYLTIGDKSYPIHGIGYTKSIEEILKN